MATNAVEKALMEAFMVAKCEAREHHEFDAFNSKQKDYCLVFPMLKKDAVVTTRNPPYAAKEVLQKHYGPDSFVKCSEVTMKSLPEETNIRCEMKPSQLKLIEKSFN